MAEKNEETPLEDRPEAGPPDQGAGPDAPPSNLNEEVEAAATGDAPEAAANEAVEAADESPAEAATDESSTDEAPAAPKPKAAPKPNAPKGTLARAWDHARDGFLSVIAAVVIAMLVITLAASLFGCSAAKPNSTDPESGLTIVAVADL